MKIIAPLELELNGDFLKEAYIEDAQSNENSDQLVWEHTFLLWKKDGSGKYVKDLSRSKNLSLRFLGNHPNIPNSNQLGIYTDGTTTQEQVPTGHIEIIDGEPVPETQLQDVLVKKPILPFILQGNNPFADPNITIVNLGYADYTAVQFYFEKVRNAQGIGKLSFNTDMALDVYESLSIPAPSELINVVQPILIKMAEEVILLKMNIDGVSLKELGFYFE